MDAVKIIENEFYRLKGESDRDLALREGCRMSNIAADKSMHDWICDPNSMRFYVLEAWGRIFEFEKSNSDRVDSKTKDSIVTD